MRCTGHWALPIVKCHQPQHSIRSFILDNYGFQYGTMSDETGTRQRVRQNMFAFWSPFSPHSPLVHVRCGFTSDWILPECLSIAAYWLFGCVFFILSFGFYCVQCACACASLLFYWMYIVCMCIHWRQASLMPVYYYLIMCRHHHVAWAHAHDAT